jgi:elongation factor 2
MVEKVVGLMKKKDHIRNMGIAAHIDHGKTTLSDNLLSGCGIISEELSGKQLFMDYDEQEQARGITINAANVSMVHTYGGEDYLINMIDTPGHVDFSGEVTRSMRAVDGVIIVVCAVEGVMPQTKTVVGQALKEKVKPLLFINKVDRLINELKLTPESMQQRFFKIISEVNRLIVSMAPPEHKKDWLVDVNSGGVAFGSAYNNWATSIPYMKRVGISFKDIIDYCNNQNQKELAKKSKLHEVLLDMVVKHLPDPLVAQKERVPNIWKGDMESEVGKGMRNCDDNGKLAVMVTKILIDPQAGEITTGRIFSGKLTRGIEVYSDAAKGTMRVQQLGVYMGPDRINVDELDAGNIVAISGLKRTMAGDTISSEPMVPFESIKHFSEPVVTKAVEPKNPADLPKLIEVMKQQAKADPTLQVTIDEETGEYLISGMGELHLEIVEYRIRKERGVDIKTSNPLVVYRETAGRKAGPIQGRSPNKHNDFFIEVEPLEDKVYQAIYEGKFPEGRRKNSKDIWQDLAELGMTKDEAKNIRDIFHGNILVDGTRGVQHLDEVVELVLDAFEQAMKRGPIAQEPCTKVKVRLTDVKLHEDAIHRGPAQVYPAIRNPIYAAMLQGGAALLEPKQNLYIQTPAVYMGSASRDIQSRRGIILDMTQEGDQCSIEGRVPVSEMFGFAGDIRSATEGNVLWSTENSGFEKVPAELQNETITQVRKRKGLDPRPPDASAFLG